MSFNACFLQVDLLQSEQLQDLFPRAFASWQAEDLPTSATIQVHPLKAGRAPCPVEEALPPLLQDPNVSSETVRGPRECPTVTEGKEKAAEGTEDVSDCFPDNLSISSCFSPRKSLKRESEERSYFEESPKKRSLTRAQEMLRRELKKQAKKLREHWAVKRVVAPSPFLKLTLKGFLAKKRKAEQRKNGIDEEEFSLI